MQLHEYIEEVGIPKLSQALNVTTRTVYYWKVYQVLPSAKCLKAIVEMSKGKVSYKSMVETYLEKQN